MNDRRKTTVTLSIALPLHETEKRRTAGKRKREGREWALRKSARKSSEDKCHDSSDNKDETWRRQGAPVRERGNFENFKTKFAPGWRDGRKHYALAASSVSSTNAEQQIHINLKEWNMPSGPTTEPPSSGTISVRKQSTELASDDQLPWSTTERCWLLPGTGTCSRWQSIYVLSTFPLIESAVFQILWKNGWK